MSQLTTVSASESTSSASSSSSSSSLKKISSKNSPHTAFNGRIKFANAPISWGINEFGIENKIITPPTFLDQVKSSGYCGSELGDYGFFPIGSEENSNTGSESSLSDSGSTSSSSSSSSFPTRKLFHDKEMEMIGAFCTYSLWNPECHAKGREDARKIARQLASFRSTQDSEPHIVLADNVIDKNRIKKAGQITQKDGLNIEKWKILCDEVSYLMKSIKKEFNISVHFHPHCGSFVETPWEIEALIRDVPNLKLIFDTAHITMGAHAHPLYLVQFLNKFGKDRVHSFHFKDYTPHTPGEDYFELVNAGCFPELGKGICDLLGVAEWQKRNDYEGWIVVEQDILGNPQENGKKGDSNTPFMCALRNRAYLEKLFKSIGGGNDSSKAKL